MEKLCCAPTHTVFILLTFFAWPMTLWRLSVFCLFFVCGVLMTGYMMPAHGSKAEPADINVAENKPSGAGALGRVEPKSRVIRLSHDAGPEGARIEELLIAEGQHIEVGALVAIFSEYKSKLAELAALQARLPVTQAQINAATADALVATNELQRARDLISEKAVSKSRLDELEGVAARTAAQLEGVRAELELLKAEINATQEDVRRSQLFSPISGTVLKIHSWPGERVSDSGLADIADLSAMDIVAQIYERDMPRIKTGQHAKIRVPGTDLAFDGQVRELGYQVMKNDLNDTDPLADRDNRVVEVRITLPPEAAEQLKHLIYMQVDVHISAE